MSQYKVVLDVAEFIRKNSHSPVVKKIKACKTQAEIFKIYKEEIEGFNGLNKNKI